MENLQLKGKRVLIEKPVRPDNGVILTEDVKNNMDMEFIKSWNKLKVVAVGDEATIVKPGDKVYVGSPLANSEIIQIDNADFFIVYESAIAIVWQDEE